MAYRIRTKQGVAKTIGDLRDNNLVENLYNIYKVFSPSTNAENFRQLTVQTVKSNLLSFFKNSSVSEILPKKHNSEEVVIHVRPA